MVFKFINCWPNKIVRNLFKVSAILSNYYSITVYRVCRIFSLSLLKSMGLPSWIITAPSC